MLHRRGRQATSMRRLPKGSENLKAMPVHMEDRTFSGPSVVDVEVSM